MTLLETERLADRRTSCAELGLDPDRPTLLVTLGAGNINDPRQAMTAAVRAALADPDWQVALTRAPIALGGLPAELRSRVTVLEGVYPLVRQLAAFDAAVSAAGYNAVHELLLAGLPTLLVPNASTSTDDQVTRAGYVAAQGWALVAAEADTDAIAAGARELLDDGSRAELRAATGGLPRPDGAASAAEATGRVASESGRSRLPRDPYQPLRTASSLVRRVVGESFWERARRVTGAPPRLLAAGPAPVLETSGQLPPGIRRLVVSHELADVSVAPDVVVEHVLAGSSADYLRERRRIIAASYQSAAS